MPRIRFTADPKLPRDMAHLGYQKGAEVDLSPDLCGRWIRRGVAVYVPEPKADAVSPLLDAAETVIATAFASDSLSADTIAADSPSGADTMGADTAAPKPTSGRARR